MEENKIARTRREAYEAGRKAAEAKAQAERAKREAQIAEERRLAALITCPKCGWTWNKEDANG